MKKKELSIIVPTYNEKDNIKILIQKISAVMKKGRINGEVVIVDDNSPDGTSEIVKKIMKKNKGVNLLERSGKLGLSSAVLDGIKIAKGEVIGVMDADFSHPIEKVPEMFSEIKKGYDFAIGSRYTKGGGIKGWPLKRLIVSKGATILARPFTRAKDPMSGFLMIKKKCLKGRKFDAKGFKICLEFLVKADYNAVKEVPIVFIDRQKGKSKASLKEAVFLLENLFGYIPYVFKNRLLK